LNQEPEVEYHPEVYQEIVNHALKGHPGFADKLLRDFKAYIKTGVPPRYFGKVEIYTDPPLAYAARLFHMHLALPPARFKNVNQRFRVCEMNKPQHDAALVYVQGELEEHRYSLLAVLYPDAHGMARVDHVMNRLARLAKEFRDTN